MSIMSIILGVLFIKLVSVIFHDINILPLLALVIMGATIHLLYVGQIRFRHPILLDVTTIAGISLYEIVLSIKNRFGRNDS